MELGNMCFGNSRGLYSVERTEGWGHQIGRLFEAIDGPEFDSYGTEYENNTFFIFPYYWGDCDCGYEEIESKASNAVEHRDSCYQQLVKTELIQKYGYKKSKWGGVERDKPYDDNRRDENTVRKKYCDQLNLTFPNGCAVHCTCDYDNRFEKYVKVCKYPVGHRSWCKIVRPNFYYKPTKFEIQWYKYPFRDSYMNQEINVNQFKTIVDDCIRSIHG